MAKMLHFITVFITAFIMLQEQATTETHQQSSTASPATSSSTASESPSTVTSTSRKADTTNRESSATSSHQAATSSEPHTGSHGKITSADQTSTASDVTNSSGTILSSTKEPTTKAESEITTNRDSAVTNSSGTTDLQSVVSVKTTSPPPDELGPTAASTGNINTSPQSVSSNIKEDNLMSPGLVAILCIFFIVVALVLGVATTKIISFTRKPQFERLEDLPMNKMNENAPFAQYPPK